MQSDFKHIAATVRSEIEELLLGVGILCRVFGRGKDSNSLNTKIQNNPSKYSIGGKLIQDAIGIRVALYFSEDIDIVKKILCSKYEIDHGSSTIDRPDSDQFAVTRYNLIFKLQEDSINTFARSAGQQPLDKTFEVQIRSILSEGWHEVEHDLRYKSKKSWEAQDDLSRALNGVLATLETSEWSMSRIFDELAYRHYKSKNWIAMLQNKLKMRIPPDLSDDLLQVFDTNSEVAKNFLRLDRRELLWQLSTLDFNLPISMNNIVYLWNLLGFKDSKILELTPQLLLSAALIKTK
jgi:ppGpp synthetase/RelA/SpoT-type nucleotidyltranferase